MDSPTNALDAVKYAQFLAKDVWRALEAETSAASYQDYLERRDDYGQDFPWYAISLEMEAVLERTAKLSNLHSLLEWYSQYGQSAISVNRADSDR